MSLVLELTERDLRFIEGLFESRVMTSSQARALFYPGSGADGCAQRIRKLAKAGYILRKERGKREEDYLYLSKKSFDELMKRKLLADYPPIGVKAFAKRVQVSPHTINHELMVMDIKVAFDRETGTFEQLSMERFLTWPRLYEFEANRLFFEDASMQFPVARLGQVKPDGFIELQVKKEDGTKRSAFFFIEADRSTEKLATIVSKAAGYNNYYKDGLFAESRGLSREDYKAVPFRVLFIVLNAERRNNIADYLWRAGYRSQMLVATIEEVVRDPFSAIWLSPGKYAEALRGTGFALETTVPEKVYKRKIARDMLVTADFLRTLM